MTKAGSSSQGWFGPNRLGIGKGRITAMPINWQGKTVNLVLAVMIGVGSTFSRTTQSPA